MCLVEGLDGVPQVACCRCLCMPPQNAAAHDEQATDASVVRAHGHECSVLYNSIRMWHWHCNGAELSPQLSHHV